MAWIKTIGFDEATGRLRDLYDGIGGKRRRIDNILAVHSLRPHTLVGHLSLYKSVLHHTGNQVEPWFLEAVGILVSTLNRCPYCVAHHVEGMRRLIRDEVRSSNLVAALDVQKFSSAFTRKETAALDYTVALTEDPSDVTVELVNRMRAEGWTDGEILEINQVASYFAYANRTVSGLGVSTDGDELGLSPRATDDMRDVRHE